MQMKHRHHTGPLKQQYPDSPCLCLRQTSKRAAGPKDIDKMNDSGDSGLLPDRACSSLQGWFYDSQREKQPMAASFQNIIYVVHFLQDGRREMQPTLDNFSWF